jgi:uncharacterized protein (DUF433 family)
MPVSGVTASPKEAAEERQRRVDAARALVVCDPGILGGTPVIRGTRVPVYTLAACVAGGDSMEDILEGYPSVTREQVELAAVFAEAFPPEEKPFQQTELPPGATLIYRRTEALRKRA